MVHRSSTVMLLAAGWNVIDIVLHVAVDRVEPLRVTGNLSLIAAALVFLIVRGSRWRLMICGITTVLVLVLNGMWAVGNGTLPLPAAVLITGTLLFIFRAAWLEWLPDRTRLPNTQK